MARLDRPKLGAHVSSSGGLSRSVERALAMGAECIQVHLSAPQQWKAPLHAQDEIRRFRKAAREAGIGPNVAHAPYLINLASQDSALWERSTEALRSALEWAARCGLKGVVVHLGSGKGCPVPEAEGRVVEALKRILDDDWNGSILLENSAGSGDCLGARFEQIASLILGAGGDPRLGMCLDIAHAFASGYDPRTLKGARALVEQLDRTVGLSRLKLIHANDSRVALGSAVDRHENIGQGQVGERGFAHLLRQAPLRRVPWILEVPGQDRQGPDRANLNVLRRLSGRPLLAEGSLDSLAEVRDEVAGVLDADGEPHQPIRDADLGPPLGRDAGMGHQRG